MFHKKVYCVFAAVLFLGVSGLWAGDTASFVDLGFSPDGKTYMFAQYGVESGTLKPWADLFVIDVPQNNFVSGGRVSFVNDSPVVAGQNGSGALYRLIAGNASLAARHRIDYCFQGQPLYIAVDPDAARAGTANAGVTDARSTGTAEQSPSSRSPQAPGHAPVEFRDFESGANYRASLVSRTEGSGAALKSSFYINLERTAKDGSKKSYTVGTPQVKRPLVTSYCIKKVMIAPRDGSMIMVIEMKRQDGGDIDIRYMVEALRL